jgi:hypothetical protein
LAGESATLKDAQDVKHLASIMQALDPNQGKEQGMALSFYSVAGDMTVENKTVVVERSDRE